MSLKRQRIAVIGAGISGLASAYFLSSAHDVILFEAGAYLGGHTNTVDVTSEGQTHPVDTGFLVYNRATYPNLIALLAELDVSSHASDMSFSVSIDKGKLEWAGTNLNSVFAQRRRLFSPSFLSMLRDILRFNKAAQNYLRRTLNSGETLGELLDTENYGSAFRHFYLLPLAAAIWSGTPADMLNRDFPLDRYHFVDRPVTIVDQGNKTVSRFACSATEPIALLSSRLDYVAPPNRATIEAQRLLSSIQGKNKVWFAEAWTGYGFHEDGLTSALRVANDFWLTPRWAKL